MLTPTGVTSSAYWNAIKAGNPTHVRMTFLGQNIVLDDSDISLTGGLTITDIFNGDTDLVFGKAVAKELTVYILNSSKLDGLLWTSEFTLEMGVDIGTPAVTYWVNIGYFTGERPKNITTVNVITFTAYDRMTKFDVLADQFVQNISYPITVQNIYNNLCTYVGMGKVSGDELPNIMSRSYASAPVEMTGYTCRDILAWIAEACGCYARINSAGKCQMVWFTDNTSHALTGDEEFNVESGDINDGLTWDEADTYKWNEFDNFTWDEVCGYQEMYSIDQIQVKQLGADVNINYPAFYGWNVYMIVDNPFLSVSSASDVTNYIAPLYNRMNTFGGYMPLNIECIGCWLVEAGDVITADVGTNTLSLPVFTRTLKWNGSVNDTYEATGNKDRKTYATESDRQQAITAKYIRLFVEDNYYHTQSGIEITANGVTISGSKSINIQSGSALDNNGVININSGGDFNVKSGGNFNVNSGGNIDIHGTGTLSLIGSTVEIKSGSTFNVDATNFKIDSSGKYVKTENFTFDNKGITYNNNNGKKIAFGEYGSFSSDTDIFSGVYGELNTTNQTGKTILAANNFNKNSSSKLIIEAIKRTNSSSYFSAVYPLSEVSTTILGKRSDNPNFVSLTRFTDAYINNIIAQPTTMTIPGDSTIYNGGSFGIVLSSTYDSADTSTWSSAAKLSFYSYENDPRGDFIYVSTGTKYLSFYPTWIYMRSINVDTTGNIHNLRYDTISQNSSRDIKHNIQDMPNMGNVLDKLNPVTFVYDNDETERQRMGLIYEDTIGIMPEICTGDESDKAISYVELIPALLKEIQDLRSRVKSLEEREVV